MLKIEKKNITYTNNYGEQSNKTIVVINDVEDPRSYISEKPITAHVRSQDCIALLEAESLAELGRHFASVGYWPDIKEWDDYQDIDIHVSEYFDVNYPSIILTLQRQELEHWSKPYSVFQFAKAFEKAINEHNNPAISYWEEAENDIANGFGLKFEPHSLELNVKSQVDIVRQVAGFAIQRANELVLNEVDPNAVLSYFKFPQEIKTACKQYLIYFIQFLADLGIDSEAEVSERTNVTLFKIIPTDKNESLERIKDALNAYLNAPNSPTFSIEVSKVNDPSVKQWEANVYHLKSQLALAQSIDTMQKATIQSLQISNYQLNEIVEIQREKMEKDREEVIPGVISVGSVEVKGIRFNLAELLRRLKRKLS